MRLFRFILAEIILFVATIIAAWAVLLTLAAKWLLPEPSTEKKSHDD